jgi:hypothetical protein
MEKPLNGASDCSHIVGCLTCAKSKVSWELCAELEILHQPDFKLAPGEKQVVCQDIE